MDTSTFLYLRGSVFLDSPSSHSKPYPIPTIVRFYSWWIYC